MIHQEEPHEHDVLTTAPKPSSKFSSPANGRWVVYNSDESGKNEIYVQAFPPTGDKLLISTAGGNVPQWRSDGNELFYLEGQKKLLMAVPVNAGGPAFEAGIPAALFAPPIIPVQRRNSYVAAANGQRFLVICGIGDMHTDSFTVVLNWEAGVKR